MSEHDYALASVAAAVAARETPASGARQGRFAEWMNWLRDACCAATRDGYRLTDHHVLHVFLQAAGDDCIAFIELDWLADLSGCSRRNAVSAVQRLVSDGELIPTGQFRGRTPVYAVRRRAEIATADVRARVQILHDEHRANPEAQSAISDTKRGKSCTPAKRRRAAKTALRDAETALCAAKIALPDLETTKPKKQETAKAVSPARAQAHAQARGEPDWVNHLVPGNYDLSQIEPALAPAAISVSFGPAEPAPVDCGADAAEAAIAAAVARRGAPILASAAEQRAADAEVERLRAELERLRAEVERRGAEPAPADPPPSPAPEFALEPPSDAAAKPKRRRKAADPGAGERLDPAWRPTGELREWTLGEVLTPQDAADELAKFREYYLEGKGRNQRRKLSGWELCWRNWIKTALPTLARYARAKRELEANKNGGTVHYLSRAEQNERRYRESVERSFARARALDEADALAAAASGVVGADHSSGGGGPVARLETGARKTVNIC